MDVLTLTVSADPPPDLPVLDRRMRFCEYLNKGFEAEAFCFQADSVSCPLGRFNLGVGPADERQRDKLAKVLVRWGDIAAVDTARAYLDRLATAHLDGQWIAVRPSDAHCQADLVVARGTPAEIMQLVQRYSRKTGLTLRCEIAAIGASCGEIVANALVRNEVTLSVGCDGTRRHGRLPDTQLLLGAPRDTYAAMH